MPAGTAGDGGRREDLTYDTHVMLVASALHCVGISSVTSPLRHQAAEFTTLHPAMSDNRQTDERAPEQGELRDLLTPAMIHARGSNFMRMMFKLFFLHMKKKPSKLLKLQNSVICQFSF